MLKISPHIIIADSELDAVTVTSAPAVAALMEAAGSTGRREDVVSAFQADVVAILPRYNPRWSWWLLRVPVLREVITWNLVLVLRRR